MSPDVRIEDAYLEELRSGFSSARDVFSSTTKDNSEIPEAVGDSTLKSRTREFYTGWDRRREDLITAMDALEEAVIKIEDAFQQVDTQLSESAENMP